MSSTNTVGKQEAWNGASRPCCSSGPVPHANTAEAKPVLPAPHRPGMAAVSKAAHISCCSSWATAEHPTCPEQLLPATPTELQITLGHVADVYGDTLEPKRRGPQEGSPTGVFLLQLLRVKSVCWMCYQLVSVQGKGRKRNLNYSSS